MELFEALKDENDFEPSTYWNRPAGAMRRHTSKYGSLKNKVTKRRGNPTPPPRTASPTPSQVSKQPSIGNSAKHTSSAEENDTKDEKAIQKIMKSKLPQFSDEKDWEAAIFELKLILARVRPHKDEMDITDYMTNFHYHRSLTEDMETRADNLLYYAFVRIVNISGQKLALYGMTNLKVSVVTAKLLAHY
jgi:hypothetical protein